MSETKKQPWTVILVGNDRTAVTIRMAEKVSHAIVDAEEASEPGFKVVCVIPGDHGGGVVFPRRRS